MRGTRAPRKTISLTEGSPSIDVSGASSSSHHSFWVVNDNGLPKSPVSIERLPPRHGRKMPRVARVKPLRKAIAHKRRTPPQESFPFFIDKSPAEESVDDFRNSGQSAMNDSVIVIESPRVNASNDAPQWPVPERRRQSSVDTVDLCSDEEVGSVVTAKGKRGKKCVGTSKKRRKVSDESLESHQPDVIVLEDEEESVVVRPAKKNASAIVEDMPAIGSHRTASNNIPSARGGRQWSEVSASISNCRSKYKDKASEGSRGQGEVPSANAGTSKTVFSWSKKSQPSNAVGSNVFNPCGSVEQSGLRPIIIDGCNVAIAHGGNRVFSVRGLCICVEYFVRRGHSPVVALVPLHQRSKVSPQDRDVLESLKNDNHLVFTPSRFIDNRLISSYDDRYIVQYAAAVGGVIVSRDNYRDLLVENPAWRDTITNRLLMPTWVGDILMFPVDPLGKAGPTLDDFLRFPDK